MRNGLRSSFNWNLAEGYSPVRLGFFYGLREAVERESVFFSPEPGRSRSKIKVCLISTGGKSKTHKNQTASEGGSAL